jgi:hypothetical protein
MSHVCVNIRSDEDGSRMIIDDGHLMIDEYDGDVIKDFVRILAKLNLADNGMYELQIYEVAPMHMLRFSVHVGPKDAD